jgi:hypothetical protein
MGLQKVQAFQTPPTFQKGKQKETLCGTRLHHTGKPMLNRFEIFVK